MRTWGYSDVIWIIMTMSPPVVQETARIYIGAEPPAHSPRSACPKTTIDAAVYFTLDYLTSFGAAKLVTPPSVSLVLFPTPISPSTFSECIPNCYETLKRISSY